LAALRCDWVLDPQSLTKSSLLGWISGARRRVGFARPQGRELAPWVNTDRVLRGRSHIVDASLKLLGPLGISSPTIRFDLPSHAEAAEFVGQFVRQAHLGCGFAVINSAASWKSKQWPTDRLGRVARYVGERHDLPTVVTWAGSREQAIAAQIVAKSGGHAMEAPPTSLPQLASLLQRARFVIGSDTGPLHLAAAMGTPCLGLYGPTHVESTGPYGALHVTLQAPCPPMRHRRQRQRDDSIMRQITVEQVCEAVDLLIRRAEAAPNRHPYAA
jgi:ADP-heptose:LPS heptosyltransferase